jgi:molybdopterin converting factor small subunit
MTTIELYTKREELIKSILTIDNEELLNKLSQAIKQYRKKMPCTYSVEEIQQRAAEFETIIESGDTTQFIPHDEAFKKYGI